MQKAKESSNTWSGLWGINCIKMNRINYTFLTEKKLGWMEKILYICGR